MNPRHLLVGIGLLAASWAIEPMAVAARPPVPQAVASPARYSSADGASEYWDFTARFDSGHRLFARFLITNEGPGDHSAVALGHLVFPDGRVVLFKNGRKQGRWQLSEDRLRIRIGSSVLDLHGSTPRLEVDNNKRGIKIFLSFRPEGIVPDELAAAGPQQGFELLDCDAPVSGSVWVEGMAEPLEVQGLLAATHAWMDESESDLALRRIEFFALGGDLSIYLSDLTEPSGGRSRRLVVERKGDAVLASNDFDLTLQGVSSGRDGYLVPEMLRFSSDAIEGEVRPGAVVVEHNPMEVLPQPFRFLLSFRSRPYRIWSDSPFEVTLRTGADGSPLQFSGSGITNVTFLNPVPEKPGV